MTFRSTISILVIAGLGLGPAVLEAQRPVYRRLPPDQQKTTISFSARMLFGVQLDLANLGEVGYPTVDPQLIPEGQVAYVFNNGQILFDPDADFTSDFSFAWENAHLEDSPTALDPNRQVATGFDVSRFRSQSTGATGSADPDSSYGWEVSYQYQWGKRTDRFRFGYLAGFAVNNLDFGYQNTVTGRGIFQSITIDLPDGQEITYVPGESIYIGDPESGYYLEPGVSFPGDLGDLEEFLSGYWDWSTGEFIETDSRVATNLSYDGIMAMVRLGPTFSWRIIKDLNLDLSAGVLGMYLNSKITLQQALINLPTSNNYVDRAQVETSDYLLGVFGEGSLRYQMTDRVGFYTGLMYFKTQDVKSKQIGTAEYELGLDTPLIGTAGMRVAF